MTNDREDASGHPDPALTRLEEREMRQVLRQASAGMIRLLTPLPRMTRLRLRLHGHVDDVAYWLVCHDHPGAAIRLWKICWMW